MRTVIMLILVLGGLLVVSAWGAWELWTEVEDDAMSVHGVIALVAGAFFTLALGGGLMALVFHSSRKGYDDEVM
jgi:hypothetical protein